MGLQRFLGQSGGWKTAGVILGCLALGAVVLHNLSGLWRLNQRPAMQAVATSSAKPKLRTLDDPTPVALGTMYLDDRLKDLLTPSQPPRKAAPADDWPNTPAALLEDEGRPDPLGFNDAVTHAHRVHYIHGLDASIPYFRAAVEQLKALDDAPPGRIGDIDLRLVQSVRWPLWKKDQWEWVGPAAAFEVKHLTSRGYEYFDAKLFEAEAFYVMQQSQAAINKARSFIDMLEKSAINVEDPRYSKSKLYEPYWLLALSYSQVDDYDSCLRVLPANLSGMEGLEYYEDMVHTYLYALKRTGQVADIENFVEAHAASNPEMTVEQIASLLVYATTAPTREDQR